MSDLPSMRPELLAPNFDWVRRAFRRDAPAPPARTVPQEQLDRHRRWAESGGVEGEQLVLTGDYAGTDLRGADLRQAVLRDVNLRGARLAGAQLQGADLTGANLWDADLLDADLTDVRGLRPAATTDVAGQAGATDGPGSLWVGVHPLGGANLCGATLPEEVGNFPALDNVAELSKNAGKLFVSLITADAFMQLIVAKTTDVQLVTNSGTTKIPVLDADIPISTLFWLGPLILLVLYVAFHLYLQRLWEMLAGLPAIFPDGMPLTQKSYPWLLNDLVRSEFPHLKERLQPLGPTQEALFTFLAYALVPLTLFPFWARYLCKQEWTVSWSHIVYAGLFVWAMLLFYYLAHRTLSRCEDGVGWWARWRGPSGKFQIGMTRLAPAAGALWAAFVYLLSWNVIARGVPREVYAPRNDWHATARTPELRPRLSLWAPQRSVPRVLSAMGYRPFADLAEAELSVKPEKWMDTAADKTETVRQTAHLKGAKLRYADLTRSFLVRADLRGADLRRAVLDSADLRGADLTGADLRGAVLRKARGLTQKQLDAAFTDAHTEVDSPLRVGGKLVPGARQAETEPTAPRDTTIPGGILVPAPKRQD